jgi:hypothetical protein
VRRALVVAALFLAPAAAAQAATPLLDLRPGTTLPRVENCIPFGDNALYAPFAGVVYKDVPAFRMNRGDVIAFDLGRENDVPVRRNIWFAVANKNPTERIYGGERVSDGIRALAWIKVVSETQMPKHPYGNGVVGDYELQFTAEDDFDFPGGGFVVGVSGSPPATFADAGCARDQVMVVTNNFDASGHFYSRFFFKPELTLNTLDNFDRLRYPKNGADHASMWGMTISPGGTYRIDVTTFIAGNYVPGPPWNLCRPPRSAPLRIYYAGDDRGFSAHSLAYRTNQQVIVVPDADIDADGWADDTEKVNDTNPTHAYASDAIADGKIDAADNDEVLGDCHLLHAVGEATTENMRIAVNRVGAHQVLARFVGDAADPLVFVPHQSFGASWDLTVTIDDSGEEPRVTVFGDHDGFPELEVYINDVHVYGWAAPPFPYSFTDTLALLPPMEVPVEVASDLP